MIQYSKIITTTFATLGEIGWLKTLMIMALAFLSPINGMLYGVLFLIFADTVTGIMASFYREDKPFKLFKKATYQHITSNKLGSTITKTLVYMLLIISGFVIDANLIVNTGLYFTKALVAVVSIREVKSLFENGSAILGGKSILKTIKSVLVNGWKQTLNDELKDK